MLGIIPVPEEDKKVNTTVWTPKDYTGIVKNKAQKIG